MQLPSTRTRACGSTDGGRTLVIDPGTFSDAAGALRGADAVLITHEHADHLDEPALRAAAAANPALRIWAPAAVAATLADLGDQVSAVGAGAVVRGGRLRGSHVRRPARADPPGDPGGRQRRLPDRRAAVSPG